MKTKRAFPGAVISKKAEASVKGGHPWIYDTEILRIDPCENGSLVDVFSEKGAWQGTGLLSEQSKIRIRLLSRNANETFGEAFWARRIRYALDYRWTVMGSDVENCRLIHGEADGLPGLTVDRYGSILVAEVLSYGIDLRRDLLFTLLIRELSERGVRIDGIFERNESPLREKEGLPFRKGWAEADVLPAPPSPVTEITENGIRYLVDVENGQKTGFFLDQKYNRAAAARLAKGRRVLDCFTHTGSFGLNALAGGAERVTSVDISESALELARSNARLNGCEDRIEYVCSDVFDLLPRLISEHAKYDYVILDPPAFTKSRRTVDSARRGYREINCLAMRLLPRGGYLATCSCSHFMEADMFLRTLAQAADLAGVQLRLIEARRQSPDHPALLNVPETEYLKFYLFQTV